MQPRLAIATFLVAAVLAVPFGAAEWAGRGFYEPDTARDRLDGFHHTLPDTDPAAAVKKVYFSAWSGYYILTPNHNTALTGSQIMPYPTNMHALLGVWKDCNGDGYIGMADGFLMEYRAELLNNDLICPTTPTLDWADPAFVPAHNDGEWVREFLAIGPDFVGQDPSPENNTNPYNIADESARIWGDWGLPEDGGKASCPLNPRPEGTYQSTGGFLRYADCFSNWQGTGTMNMVFHTLGQPGLAWDAGGAAKERPDQSTSPLNQKNPWGQESDASYVGVFDCSNRIVLTDDTKMTHVYVADPTPGWRVGNRSVNFTDENYQLFLMGTPGVPSVNPSGSAAGTVNETGEGAGFPYRVVTGAAIGSGEGNCDRNDDAGGIDSGQIYEADERPFEGTVPKRTQTDVWYSFTEGSPNGLAGARSDAPFCVDVPRTSNISESDRTCEEAPWRGWPNDLGQGVFIANSPGSTAGTWFGSPGYAASRNPYINRDNLEPWGGVYYTAYAFVDESLGFQTAGGSGVYGSDHCNGLVEKTGGMNCNPDAWWLGPDGKKLPTNPAPAWQITVGQPYNLRDIDCYDATVHRDVPVNTGLVGKNQCAR